MKILSFDTFHFEKSKNDLIELKKLVEENELYLLIKKNKIEKNLELKNWLNSLIKAKIFIYGNEEELKDIIYKNKLFKDNIDLYLSNTTNKVYEYLEKYINKSSSYFDFNNKELVRNILNKKELKKFNIKFYDEINDFLNKEKDDFKVWIIKPNKWATSKYVFSWKRNEILKFFNEYKNIFEEKWVLIEELIKWKFYSIDIIWKRNNEKNYFSIFPSINVYLYKHINKNWWYWNILIDNNNNKFEEKYIQNKIKDFITNLLKETKVNWFFNFHIEFFLTEDNEIKIVEINPRLWWVRFDLYYHWYRLSQNKGLNDFLKDISLWKNDFFNLFDLEKIYIWKLNFWFEKFHLKIWNLKENKIIWFKTKKVKKALNHILLNKYKKTNNYYFKTIKNSDIFLWYNTIENWWWYFYRINFYCKYKKKINKKRVSKKILQKIFKKQEKFYLK